jgi:hypothetical protein
MLILSLTLMFAAADAPAAVAPEKEKKVCRNVERTGTRMSKRKCLTADEWAMLDKGDRAKLQMLDQQYKQNVQGQ